MSGTRSRNKGARFERLLVTALKACFPDAHRGQQAHNPRHADVEGTPFRIEAKHYAKPTYKTMQDALAQAEENGARFEDERIPVAVVKQDGKPPMVMLTLRRFIQMIERHFYAPPEVADVIPIRPPAEEKHE